MIEHPYPTPGTAKSLYARALHCAYPECSEPLYREDERSGAWTLNSRICHICARSENGPRWDSKQTSDQNRSEANLIVMCIAHASRIDDPANVASYPSNELLRWKSAQIQEHKQASLGWPLTETMAEEALAKSFPDFNLSIKNSQLNLGGKGGNAPGSGGGGGGAIGPGAQAGKGGKGGNITNSTGDRDFSDLLSVIGENGEEPAPGSGGPGAGARGPGSIAGDGGGGGDILIGKSSVEADDKLEIKVGSGGEGARLQGHHSQAGGDSYIVHKAADGRIKHVYRAAGGRGARSGELPSDWQMITTEDLNNSFQISTLFLANTIEFRDGLFFVLGGGWTVYRTSVLPFDAHWPVVCRATWRKLENRVTRGLQLCLSNPDGHEVSCTALELPANSQSETGFTWIKTLGAPLDQEGLWRVSVISGDLCLSEIECLVALVES